MIAKYRAKRIDNGEWVYGDKVEIKYPDDYKIQERRVFIVDAMSFQRREIHEDGFYYLLSCLEQFCPEVDPETVGQWIGLQDKDGTDIYQDDIVLIKFDEVWYHSRNEEEEMKNEKHLKTGKTLYTVCTYLNGRFTFRCCKAIDDETGERCENLENRNYEVKWRCKHYEVIGNIHDNPELVKP